MITARRLAGMTLAVLPILMTVGCGMSPKDQQIEALQEQNNQLRGENADLRNRLAQAVRERDEARQRALDLAQQVRDLQGGRRDLPEGWQESGVYRWTSLSEDILFDSGKADIKAAGKAKLQEIVRQIQGTAGDNLVWVIGHTDTDPIKHSKWKDNLELSVQRGAAVTREFYGMGLEKVKVIAGGQGEWNPRAPNQTTASKSLNRRVQILLAPPIGLDTSGEPAADRRTESSGAAPRDGSTE